MTNGIRNLSMAAHISLSIQRKVLESNLREFTIVGDNCQEPREIEKGVICETARGTGQMGLWTRGNFADISVDRQIRHIRRFSDIPTP